MDIAYVSDGSGAMGICEIVVDATRSLHVSAARTNGIVRTFVRKRGDMYLDGDFCRVVIQNGDVVLYSLTRHDYVPTGDMSARRPAFDREISGSGIPIVTSHYRPIRGEMRPVWRVRVGDYDYFFDGETCELVF